jgi:hypothetical protein
MHEGLFADIRQPVGSSFESGPVEVSLPHGYWGAFNYEAFRDIAEEYYGSFVRELGIMGAASGRVLNNVCVEPCRAEFEVSGGTW